MVEVEDLWLKLTKRQRDRLADEIRRRSRDDVLIGRAESLATTTGLALLSLMPEEPGNELRRAWLAGYQAGKADVQAAS